MKLSVHEPLERIFHLRFDEMNEMAEAFLRFQEHYESPEFKGKIFTLDEYKEWYMENSPDAKEAGEFTYYDDWGGFNIPSEILEPFYDGKFDPLSDKERMLLDVFLEHRGKLFYIIATGKSEKEGKDESSLKHELAHGLFYVHRQYRSEAPPIIAPIDPGTRRQIAHAVHSVRGHPTPALQSRRWPRGSTK